METFSALLAICAGNSPVTGEFPTQRPVTRSFDVSLDLHLNKQLSKQWPGWWFKTPSRPLWRHCNVISNPNQRDPTVRKVFATFRFLVILTGNITVGQMGFDGTFHQRFIHQNWGSMESSVYFQPNSRWVMGTYTCVLWHRSCNFMGCVKCCDSLVVRIRIKGKLIISIKFESR